MRVGITGHQRLAQVSDWEWTRSELSNTLRCLRQPLIGVSALAIGSDQMFAQLVLNLGGVLEVVIPFDEYERTFGGSSGRDEYLRLLKLAKRVSVLPNSGCDEQAYWLAGITVLERCELLLAVWDGQPAVGLGGTGDIVISARRRQKPLIHLNPVTREIHAFNLRDCLTNDRV